LLELQSELNLLKKK